MFEFTNYDVPGGIGVYMVNINIKLMRWSINNVPSCVGLDCQGTLFLSYLEFSSKCHGSITCLKLLFVQWQTMNTPAIFSFYMGCLYIKILIFHVDCNQRLTFHCSVYFPRFIFSHLINVTSNRFARCAFLCKQINTEWLT